MYNPIYNIKFQSLNKVNYEIKIEGLDYSGDEKELTPGSSPFILSTDEGDALIPIRASRATVQIISDEEDNYLNTLYTSNPLSVRVTLFKDGVIEWLGYLLQDTFSQNFDDERFTFEMECVCALSTLKYKKFIQEDDTVTFIKLIQDAAMHAGYNDIYLTNNIKSKNGENPYNTLKVATGNFIDELGEKMSYYEILEDIAKYLGCTFVPYKDSLMLVDYVGIRLGYNGYYHYGDTIETVILKDDKNTQELGFRGSGANLNRIPGKNKATVNCSLYEINKILPTFDEEGSSWSYSEEFTEQVKEGKTTNIYKGIIRYYTQPKFTFYQYTNTNPPNGSETTSPISPTELGSMFVRTAEFNIDYPPSRLSMTNEVMVRRCLDYNNFASGKYLRETNPVLRINSGKRIIIHNNVWFCINLQLKVCNTKWTKDPSLGDYKLSEDGIAYQKAKFRIGNYYYTGSGWSTTESIFSMPISLKKGQSIYNVYLNLDNLNTYQTGLGDLTGYIFQAPNQIVFGDIEFTLYSNTLGLIINSFAGLAGCYLYFKNIEINYGIPDISSIYGDYVGDKTTNDVIYETEIDGDYVEKADDINLRICTNPDNKLCLSSVFDNNGFVDRIQWCGNTDQPEYHLLNKVISLYKYPRIEITPTVLNDVAPYSLITDSTLPEIKFIVSGGEEDFSMDSITLNLKEI